MKRALIGHTGFVGSTLRRDETFTDLFNSANFRDMAGQEFDEVVCAGVSAVKWLANREPDKDWEGIEALLGVLREVRATRFTLISTIDVYPDASQPLDEAHRIGETEGQPYGRHRLAVERFVEERFEDPLIARLPALFGRGLKKNIVFDLLAGNQTDRINPAAVFQWYPLARLSADLRRARAASLGLVNLFPEPVATRAILDTLFPEAVVGPPVEPAPHYRLQTAHAAAFGGTGPYLMPAGAVMADLSRFVEAARLDPGAELG